MRLCLVGSWKSCKHESSCEREREAPKQRQLVEDIWVKKVNEIPPVSGELFFSLLSSCNKSVGRLVLFPFVRPAQLLSDFDLNFFFFWHYAPHTSFRLCCCVFFPSFFSCFISRSDPSHSRWLRRSHIRTLRPFHGEWEIQAEDIGRVSSLFFAPALSYKRRNYDFKRNRSNLDVEGITRPNSNSEKVLLLLFQKGLRFAWILVTKFYFGKKKNCIQSVNFPVSERHKQSNSWLCVKWNWRNWSYQIKIQSDKNESGRIQRENSP